MPSAAQSAHPSPVPPPVEANLTALYGAMMQAPLLLCVLHGPQHVFTFANPRYQELFGGRELVGRSLLEMFPELEAAGIRAMLDGVLRSGESFVGTEVQVDLDFAGRGQVERRYYDFVYHPMKQGEETTGILVIATETTEAVLARRTAAEQQARRTAQLQRLAEAAVAINSAGDEEAVVREAVVQAQALLGGTVSHREGAAPDTQGGLVAPLRSADGRALGALHLQARSGEAPSAEEQSILVQLAQQASVALQNARLLREAQEREAQQARRTHHALLAADVGAALTRTTDLREMLQHCAQALVARLDASFARVWTVNHAEAVLELQASAGLYTHIDGGHARVPVGSFKIGRIAASGKPHLTNDVQHDPQVGDREWAKREGMVSFAGYPLTLDGQVIGVMALFAKKPLPDDALQALGAVADAVALGVGRKRNDEALRRSEQTLKTLSDNATLGLLLMDARQHCTFMNPAAEEILGLTFEDVASRDQPLHDLIHHTRPDGTPYPMAECPIDRALPARNQEQGEDLFVRPDGSFYPVSFSASPILNAGVPVGTVIEFRDITVQKRAEAERERLIRALERTNAELDQFAYVASHDLKAPLRGIASLAQWVEEDAGPRLGDQGREQLGLLRGRVHRMEALIDGILDYSRAGRVRHKSETVDVGALVGEAVDLLAPGPGTRVNIAAGLPVLEAERVPLQQVFMNLLSNALKHAAREGAVVGVGHRPVGGGMHHFSVRDNGPGIAPEYHEKIWNIFQTLKPRDRVEGTGIGLSVVKKIVESRGGRAWVESRPGEGATFHFTWPHRVTEELS
jgi:PAS domain S-box-containing protein